MAGRGHGHRNPIVETPTMVLFWQGWPSQWNPSAKDIVYQGNIAKFTQNHKVRKLLLATGDKRLVEASPMDRIWGIGLHADDPRSRDESQWEGTNWLGNVLERVRTTLRE